MRKTSAPVAGIPALLAAAVFCLCGASAHGQVARCVGTDGKVTYSDQECATAQPAPIKKLGDAEQLTCAYNWLFHGDSYREMFGIGGDRIIMNGKEVASSAPAARAAVQRLDPVLANCAAAGIVKPRSLDDLVNNQWNAVQKICDRAPDQVRGQAASLIYLPEEVRKERDVMRTHLMTNSAAVCQEFRNQSPSPAAIRASYREKITERQRPPPAPPVENPGVPTPRNSTPSSPGSVAAEAARSR